MKKNLTSIIMTLVFILMSTTILADTTSTKDYSAYKTNVLISPESAEKMIETENNILVLDVRKPAAFEQGHAKTSFQIWRPDFSADKGEYNYNGMRASAEKMAKTLSSFGATSDTHIILLSAKADYDAARLWWILDYYGHDNVSIVDGGIDGWKAANLPMVKGKATKPSPTNYVFKNEVNKEKYANIEDVKGATKNDVVIIDTRSDIEYDGLVQEKGAFTKGRIPTSVHIEWNKMVNSDNTFKSPEEMKAILAEKGISSTSTVIAYCQSAVRSAHMTFVLTQLLGYKDVKNYDGSWIEWSYNTSKGNVVSEKDGTFKTLFSYITHRDKLEGIIKMLGIWGPLVYILIYALVTITMISPLPVTITGGIIFGPVMGILYTLLGAGLGLALAFLIARYIARGFIEKKFGNSTAFKKIDEGVRKEGWFILATTRLLPIFPFGIQNYVYGLTSIRFVQYTVLSIIFMIPGTAVFVMLAGAFASGDTGTVIKYSITASLIFMGLMVITKIIKKKSEASTK